MALSLLGYFFSMTTVLGILMMLLNGLVGDSAFTKVRHQPYPMPIIAAASASPAKAGAAKARFASNTPSAADPAPAQPANASARQSHRDPGNLAQQRQARERQRRLAARQREQRNAMVALGYAAQPWQSSTTFPRLWN